MVYVVVRWSTGSSEHLSEYRSKFAKSETRGPVSAWTEDPVHKNGLKSFK